MRDPQLPRVQNVCVFFLLKLPPLAGYCLEKTCAVFCLQNLAIPLHAWLVRANAVTHFCLKRSTRYHFLQIYLPILKIKPWTLVVCWGYEPRSLSLIHRRWRVQNGTIQMQKPESAIIHKPCRNTVSFSFCNKITNGVTPQELAPALQIQSWKPKFWKIKGKCGIKSNVPCTNAIQKAK